MYRRFLDALILVEMLALNCVLKDSLKRMRMDGGSINICRSKDLTLSNSSKASFSSLVISSSRDSIPPSPAATFTAPAFPNMWNTACRGLSWPTARRGLRKLHLCRIWSGATICTMGACLLFRPHTGHLIGPQPALDRNLLRGIGLLQ